MRHDSTLKRRGRLRTAEVRARPTAPRPGTTLIEVIASMILLGIVFAGSIPAVVWVVRTQRALERRQAALLHAANLLDELTSRPWNRLDEGVPVEELDRGIVADFPALRLTARVTPETEPRARRVTVEIAWEEAPGRPTRPVKLHGWAFPSTGAAP